MWDLLPLLLLGLEAAGLDAALTLGGSLAHRLMGRLGEGTQENPRLFS